MSVHKAISKHSETQHDRIRRFHLLEERREQYIDEAINQCTNHLPFTVDKINEVTKEINQLARQGIVPTRKLVTVEMVKEYVERKNKLQK